MQDKLDICNSERRFTMVDFKADERLNTLNHSCAHVMAQAVKHLYPNAKFWVGPVVKEGFYYDIDLGDAAINDDAIAAIEKEMKKICKEGKKIYRREISKADDSFISMLGRRCGIATHSGTDISFEEYKQREYDKLADAIRENMDMKYIYDIMGL